jgi:hypothetical protein
MDTASLNWYTMVYTLISAIISILIGIFLLRLRVAASSTPTTQVQRWGMSFLGWLFLLNGIINLISTLPPSRLSSMLGFMSFQLSSIPPLFALGLAFVFPKPYLGPASFTKLVLVLTAITAIVLAVVMTGTLMPLGTVYPDPFIWVTLTWAFVLYRWSALYRDSRDHPEVAMINTALIWAFLFNMIVRYDLWNDLALLTSGRKAPGTVAEAIMLATMVFIIARLLVELYHRRGKWGAAERTHAGFLGVIAVITLIDALLRSPPGSEQHLVGPVGFFLINTSYMGFQQVVGIDLVRPALLCYALLRYQFFGRELRVERFVIILATLMMACYGGLYTAQALGGLGINAMATGLCIMFALLLYPAYNASRWLVNRVIPGVRELTRKEARNIYYISLQGGTHKGRITEQSDEEALAALRKSLGVTEREHTLLLEQERQKAHIGGVRSRIKYAMLVDESGRLAINVGPADEAVIDKEILAGMLTAVRSFVSDAFKSGSSSGHGELDVLRYGDRTMVMEKGGGFILAAAIDGEAGPTIRTAVGDMLTILLKRHGNILFEWDGNVTDAEPAKLELQRMVDSYNISGGI